MNILLFSPIQRSYVVMPNLGLGYLSSILRKNGHSVKLLNCIQLKMTFEDFESYIRSNKFDIIGVQVFTYDIDAVQKHIEIIKKIQDECLIILGGPHPSCAPYDVLNEIPGSDFAFAGESEIGLSLLVSRLEKIKNESGDKKDFNYSEIPGLIWRSNNEIKVNQNVFVDDLDSLLFPAWDLMDPRKYPEAPHGAFAAHFPVAPMIITRGCPFPCNFCAGKSITGKRVRKRTIGNVIEEIKYLKQNFNVKEFNIEDENLTLHKDFALDFCKRLIDEKLNIRWNCPSGIRLDTLDEELLKVMEKSGCYSFGLGIESGSNRVLKMMRKSVTIEKLKEKVDLIAKTTKIKMTGFFILGFPGETREERIQTLKFAMELPLHRVQFNNFMPLPGSEIYEVLKNSGKLGELDFKHFFVHDVAYVSDGTSVEELKNIQRKGYLGFYLRPKVIFGLLGEIKSFRHFVFLIRRFIDAMK